MADFKNFTLNFQRNANYFSFNIFKTIIGSAGFLLFLISLGIFIVGLLGSWNTDLDSAAIFRPQLAILALFAGGFMLFARWILPAIGASLLAMANLYLLGPAWETPRSIGTATLAAGSNGCNIEHLRVALANVEGTYAGASNRIASASDTKTLTSISNAVSALNIDILATVETSRVFDKMSASQGGRFNFAARNSSAALWSTKPLHAVKTMHPSRRPPHAVGQISVGGRLIGLAAIHLPRPLIDDQAGAIRYISEIVKDLPPDRIVLGDFNSAIWTATMSRIATLSGVRLTGGFRITWNGAYTAPFSGWRVQSLMGAHIDHILASQNIGFHSIETFVIEESVHKGVIAELEVPTAECGEISL